MSPFKLCRLVALVVLLCPLVSPQTQSTPQCGITLPAPPEPKLDMFSPAQEVQLGDVLADSLQDLYEIDDPELSAYLQKIGGSLVKSLPTSDLKFRFYLSNAPEANAWSISGGRIYVTRKLIAMLRS